MKAQPKVFGAGMMRNGTHISSNYKRWKDIIDDCYKQRIRAGDFKQVIKFTNNAAHIKSIEVADIVLRPRSKSAAGFDPLQLEYVETLLRTELVSAVDVLRSLLTHSADAPSSQQGPARKDSDGASSKKVPTEWHHSPEFEEAIFFRIAELFKSKGTPKSVQEAQLTFRVVAMWMEVMVTSSSNEMVKAMNGELPQIQPHTAMVRLALARLVESIAVNERMVGVLQAGLSKAARRAFSRALTGFLPLITASSPQTAAKLEFFQQQNGLLVDGSISDAGTNGANLLSAGTAQLESIVDLEVVNTRAGNYVFLHALLVGRPLTDDSMILAYLNMRYKGDMQSLAVDLATAGFDLLANGMYTNESSATMFSYRAFLINKIPLLLSALTGTMLPLNAESCVSQTLARIDTAAFPTIAFEFMQSQNTQNAHSMVDIRPEFVVACALHHLVPEQSIDRLLGETSMHSLPAGGRLGKDALMAQCAANSDRIAKLVEKLETLDGNAGAIVAALAEIIQNLCAAKDTMSLKSICSLIARRPGVFDVIMQFSSPLTLLQPLCQQLDTWMYEDDQGEYQPVYDEFAAVLLLVLAFVHRYKLKKRDIGIMLPDSFMGKLLDIGANGKSLQEVSDQEAEHLKRWIRGLYEGDEGINDDLMSSCRPQEFYLLVPTLFEQSVQACASKVLDIETMKSGLEYLLEPFLLPSLVLAIPFLTHHSWRSVEDTDIVMQILHKLVLPSNISGDARGMHSTIISMVSRQLEHALRDIRRREPVRQDVDPLITALKPQLDFQRTPESLHLELETWTATPGGGLIQCIRNAVQSLTMWAPELALTPPAYTHRLLLVGIKIFGACRVLRTIVEEVKTLTEGGNGPIALDVATSLICAPSAENSPVPLDALSTLGNGAPQPPRTAMNLREALALEMRENASALMTSDAGLAEAIVRLHRRVEAQAQFSLTVQSIPEIAQPMGDDILQGMEMSTTEADAVAAAAAVADATVAANAAVDQMQELGVSLDATGQDVVDMAAMGVDTSMDDLFGTSGGGNNNDDDIFGGLLPDNLDFDFE